MGVRLPCLLFFIQARWGWPASKKGVPRMLLAFFRQAKCIVVLTPVLHSPSRKQANDRAPIFLRRGGSHPPCKGPSMKVKARLPLVHGDQNKVACHYLTMGVP